AGCQPLSLAARRAASADADRRARRSRLRQAALERVEALLEGFQLLLEHLLARRDARLHAHLRRHRAVERVTLRGGAGKAAEGHDALGVGPLHQERREIDLAALLL